MYSREADYEDEDYTEEYAEEEEYTEEEEIEPEVEEEYIEEEDVEPEVEEEYDSDELYDESDDFDVDDTDDAPEIDYETIARRAILYCQIKGYPQEDMPKYIDMLVYNTPNDIPELDILLEQKAAMDEEEALYKEFVEVTNETKRLTVVSIDDVNGVEKQINSLIKPTFADVVNVEAKIADCAKSLTALNEACGNNLHNSEVADLTSQHRELIASDVSDCQARLETAEIKLDDCRKRVRAIRDELQALQVEKKDNPVDTSNNSTENKPTIDTYEIFKALLGDSPLSGGL